MAAYAGIQGPLNRSEFFKGMQESTDSRIGSNFKRGTQVSTDRWIGLNFWIEMQGSPEHLPRNCKIWPALSYAKKISVGLRWKSAYHPGTELADPELRETDYIIHINTTLLPSSGRILVNLILVHTKSTIAFSTRWVSTTVKNLTSR